MSDTMDEQGRIEPAHASDEADTLVGFLDYQRATLAWKTRGLSDEHLHQRLPHHPSGMTLAGLLKHLAYVEDFWFSEVVAGDETIEPWASVDWSTDGDWEWCTANDDSSEHLHELWQASLDRSRAVITDRRGDLGATFPAWGGKAEVSLRWVLTHMIEEYARHNGHADLLRELIDDTANGE